MGTRGAIGIRRRFRQNTYFNFYQRFASVTLVGISVVTLVGVLREAGLRAAPLRKDIPARSVCAPNLGALPRGRLRGDIANVASFR